MAQAAQTTGDYRSFNTFFTRALKPGARVIADTNSYIVSPADGVISQIGRIENGRIFQAKGQDFTVTELIGGDAALAERFNGGSFATIYLSPRDYHRVHMPVTGTLHSTTYVPGQLFSVNQVTAGAVPRLFARNERLSSIFTTELGIVASVMVGAMIVAGIETVWAGPVQTHGKRLIQTSFPQEGATHPPRLEAGAEMGRFMLGSTVILLFESNRVAWMPELKAGDAVQMGQALAHKI